MSQFFASGDQSIGVLNDLAKWKEVHSELSAETS